MIFDFLAAGETATVVIQYTATDDSANALSDTSTLTLTVTGANDAPVAVADVAQATEGNVVTVDVLANDTDRDASDLLRVTSTTLISMTLDADGSAIAPGNAAVSFQDGRVTFDPGSDFDFLAEGETATVVINYQMSDDDGSPLTDSASFDHQDHRRQ